MKLTLRLSTLILTACTLALFSPSANGVGATKELFAGKGVKISGITALSSGALYALVQYIEAHPDSFTKFFEENKADTTKGKTQQKQSVGNTHETKAQTDRAKRLKELKIFLARIIALSLVSTIGFVGKNALSDSYDLFGDREYRKRVLAQDAAFNAAQAEHKARIHKIETASAATIKAIHECSEAENAFEKGMITKKERDAARKRLEQAADESDPRMIQALENMTKALKGVH